MKEKRDKTDLNEAPHYEDIKEAVDAFRRSVEAASERPEIFWQRQHAIIMSRVHEPLAETNGFSRWLWVSGTPALLLIILFFLMPGKTPKPDLPAGADQILLIEIESALRRKSPEAVVPVTLPSVRTEQPYIRQN